LLVNQDWYNELELGQIKDVKPIAGGDINLAFKITSDTGKYFLKVQQNNNKNFFSHEIEGLKLIGEVANAPIPIKSGTFENNGYLILNYIEFGRGSQYDLGQLVAHMHQKHADRFGLNDNVTNSKNPKINTWQDNWGYFFIEQRLKVLVNIIKQKVYWNDYRDDLMNQFEDMILDYYQTHTVQPCLLHGDLWNGNIGFQGDNQPILFDPDVFYGNREMDIAMTMLFGGFTRDFYVGYDNIYPLEKGWEKRIPWYQSYYLLAHLNLFGETYGASLESALQQSLENFT